MSQPKPTFCFHCSVLSSMVLETWFEQKPPPIYFAFFKNFENFSDKISKQKYWFMEERKKSQKITRYSLNCLNFFLRYQTPQSLMNFSFVWTIFLHTWFLRNDQVSSFYNSRKMRGGGGGGSTSSRSTVHCSDQKMEK